MRPLDTKGLPATTRARGVGILEHKSLAPEPFSEIEDDSLQVHRRFRVHIEGHAALFDHVVALAFWTEIEGVGQAAAPASLHAEPNAVALRFLLLESLMPHPRGQKWTVR